MSLPTKSAPPPPSGPHATAADSRPHLAALLTLAALGWYVIEIRPDRTRPVLWHVTIKRFDEYASITVTEVDPDEALDELIRYAAVDGAVRAAPAAVSGPAAASDERPPAVATPAERPEEQ